MPGRAEGVLSNGCSPTIERTQALRYGSGRSSLEKPNHWLFVGLRPTAPHPIESILRCIAAI
jgi:hypothetical protein